MLEDGTATIGILVDGVRYQQVAARPAVRSADTPAQLIELGQSESVSAIHEHGIRVWHVEARFDDHRRDEHVDVPIHEAAHDRFQLALAHLAVTDSDSRARHHSPNVVSHPVDGLDAVVNKENLTAAIELA